MSDTTAAPTLASVVVLAIQDFGRKPVAEQIKQKTALEKVVRELVSALADGDRLVLDAPGGFAVAVLGLPAAALRLAERAQAEAVATELPLRIGVNHGPIRLFEDPRRGTGLVGDGVLSGLMVSNAAQPGKLLASRTFREALKTARSERVGELRQAGTITDPDVRTHETFTLDESIGPARRKRRLWVAVVGVAVIVGLGFAGRFARVHYDLQSPFVRAPDAPAVAIAPQPVPAPQPAPAPAPAAEPAPAAAPAPAAKPEPAPVAKAAPAPAKAAPSGPAIVEFRITPRGDIYVDGKWRGTSPPLTRLELKPGKHNVEVRSSPHAPLRLQLSLSAGEVTRVRHGFPVAAAAPKPQPAPAPAPAPAAKPAPKPQEERTVGEFARDAIDEVKRFGRRIGF